MSSEPWIDPPSRERTRSIDEFQQAGDLDDQTIAQIYTAIADGPSRLQQAVQLYLHQYHPQTQHHTRAQRRGGSAGAGADTLTDEKEVDEDDMNDKLASTSLSRPTQNPTFLLYPSLPASPFHASSTLSWCSTLQSSHADITAEFCKLWSTQRHTFTNVTYNLDGGSWAIYPIVNQGLIDSTAASSCPVTTSLIREASSVITTDCSLGYVYFSVITPGTKITPHTGVCNLKLRGHLGLIIPDPEKYDCTITVANETHTWKEGECLLFDDSYQHSVVHVPRDGVTPKPIDTLPTETSSQITALRDSGLRVVLLFDYWHPALSEKEIQVVRTFLRAS